MTRSRGNDDARAVLRRLSGRFRREAVLRGLRANALLLLVSATLVLHFDALLRPGAGGLLLLLVLAAAVQSAAIFLRVILPAARHLRPLDLARRLERCIPAFSGRLVAAVEEGSSPPPTRRGYSRALRETAIARATELLERTGEAVIRRRLGYPERTGSTAGRLLATACAGLLAGGILIGRPVPLVRSVERVASPLALYRAERTWDLEVEPGDAALMEGEDLVVRLRPPEGRVDLEPRVRTVESDGVVASRAMVPVDSGSFETRFEALTEGFRYRVSEGGRRSPEYRVAVEAYPGVTELTIRVVPPRHTGLPPSESGGERKAIFAPVGSTVEISGRGSKNLDAVEAVFSGGKRVALAVVGARDFRGEIPAAESDSFRVVPVDRSGHRGEGGRVYALRLVEDRRPEVWLLRPAADREIDRSLEELVRFEASDDYGLADLRIDYTVETRGGEEKRRGTIAVAAFSPGKTDTLLDHVWDLRPLGLFPGDRVRFRVRARDNDTVTGPKEGTSGSRVLTLPTVAELFARTRGEMGAVAEDVAGAVEEAGRLRAAIESLEREIRAAGGADWEGRREAAGIARKQQDLVRELRSAAERFARSVEGMRRGGEISPELLRRADEVSRLFQEVATPEMIAAMEALRRALEEVDPARMEKALQDLRFSEEAFRKGLEKTWRALRKLQMEQRLEALSRMAGEIRDRQEVLNRRLESDVAYPSERAEAEEEAIARDTEGLEEGLESVPGEMRAAGEEESAGELERLSEEMAALALPAGMQEIAGMIQAGEGRRAASKGSEIARGLDGVGRRLDAVREGLRRKWRTETRQAIDRAIEDLLVLSRAEEALMTGAPAAGETGPRVDDFIEEQGVLTEGLERVAGALLRSSEETYYIGREVGTRIAEALSRMRRSARRLESTGRGDASVPGDAREAVRGLNGALLALMRDQESMDNASSGVGFEEAFRRMMALARSQAALNEQAGGFFPLPLPGRREGAALARELLRMAAEQRRIREGLESVRRGLDGENGVLGRLDEIAREMEEVGRDLAEGRLREETLDRQRRILSRMLDAQRSLRRREESRRREAEAPRPFRANPPPALSDETVGRRAATGPVAPPTDPGAYPEGYREAIRAYLGRMTERSPGEEAE